MFIVILIIVLLFFLFRIFFLTRLIKKAKAGNTVQLPNNYPLEKINEFLLNLGEKEGWILKQEKNDNNRKTLIFFAEQKPLSRIFSLMAPNEIEIVVYPSDDKTTIEYSSKLIFKSRSFLNFSGLGLMWGTVTWMKDNSFAKINAAKIEKFLKENFPDSLFQKNIN